MSEVSKSVNDSVVQELVYKPQLESNLKCDLYNVLQPFGDVLSNKSGCTDLLKHTIKLVEGAKPIVQKAYRLILRN